VVGAAAADYDFGGSDGLDLQTFWLAAYILLVPAYRKANRKDARKA